MKPNIQAVYKGVNTFHRAKRVIIWHNFI